VYARMKQEDEHQLSCQTKSRILPTYRSSVNHSRRPRVMQLFGLHCQVHSYNFELTELIISFPFLTVSMRHLLIRAISI
jgi:hypothetical protein